MAKRRKQQATRKHNTIGKTNDTRTTPARNIVSSADANRGGAHQMKKNYKRTQKHKGKVFEGVSFKNFMEMCSSCGCGGAEQDSPESLAGKIAQLKLALDQTSIDQSTKDTLQAMIDELSYEQEITPSPMDMA